MTEVTVTQADKLEAEAFWQEYGPFRMGTVSALAAAFARHRANHAQGEAVAWMIDDNDGFRHVSDEQPRPNDWPYCSIVPLYAHPPAQDVEALVDDLEMACALIQEAKGIADGPNGGSVTDHLDAAENWIDRVTEALAKFGDKP